MDILGISAFYHDSAAALIRDGKVVAAAQEERFTRKKHDPRFPHFALDYCLREAKTSLEKVDHVAFYEKPFLKFERLLETYVATAPRGFKSFRMAVPVWVKEKLFQKSLLVKELRQHSAPRDISRRLLFTEHHASHAASAFYPSPFQRAAIVTMDGVGEWTTTSCAIGEGNQVQILKEIPFPHSLGLLYSAFTYYCGFKVNSGEYKLMGLAPYGVPKFAKEIRDHLIDVHEDGSFHLNMEYFDYCTDLRMTGERFHALFGGPPRDSKDVLTQHHMDLAASIQLVTEEIVLRLGQTISRETGAKNLCLAGGVALNCVANGKLLRSGIFDKIWIQPAAGDAGGALGAALAAHFQFIGGPREPQSSDSMQGAYLGPDFSQSEIETRLRDVGARFSVLKDGRLLEACVRALAAGEALGWFQGRMEFGPRALGARSILGDARSKKMQSLLNLKVKFRESFRPFAPIVLREHVSEWFDLNEESPYMLLVAPVAERRRLALDPEEQRKMMDDPDLRNRVNVARSTIPAVTHVDYSARIQTVDRERNAILYALLKSFHEATSCPVLVNTSFNVRGEPIVCTPEDAFRCFMGTDIEALAIGNCFLRKEDQDSALKQDYSNAFELD